MYRMLLAVPICLLALAPPLPSSAEGPIDASRAHRIRLAGRLVEAQLECLARFPEATQQIHEGEVVLYHRLPGALPPELEACLVRAEENLNDDWWTWKKRWGSFALPSFCSNQYAQGSVGKIIDALYRAATPASEEIGELGPFELRMWARLLRAAGRHGRRLLAARAGLLEDGDLKGMRRKSRRARRELAGEWSRVGKRSEKRGSSLPGGSWRQVDATARPLLDEISQVVVEGIPPEGWIAGDGLWNNCGAMGDTTSVALPVVVLTIDFVPALVAPEPQYVTMGGAGFSIAYFDDPED